MKVHFFQKPVFHPEALTVSFRLKHPLSKIFSDVINLFCIKKEDQRPILHFGDPRLNMKSETVSFDYLQSVEYREIIQQLLDRHEKSGSIGLAAPQIGVNKQIIVIGVTKNTVRQVPFEFPVQILINPQIIAYSESMEEGREGCLSLPNVLIDVLRYTDIQVSYMSLKDGSTNVLQATGLVARVIQHEIDHLNGINFLSRSTNLNSMVYTQKMVKINE